MLSFTQSEFDWTPETIGVVDSSFFWGYIVTQIPGGFLAARFPANRYSSIFIFLPSARPTEWTHYIDLPSTDHGIILLHFHIVIFFIIFSQGVWNRHSHIGLLKPSASGSSKNALWSCNVRSYFTRFSRGMTLRIHSFHFSLHQCSFFMHFHCFSLSYFSLERERERDHYGWCMTRSHPALLFTSFLYSSFPSILFSFLLRFFQSFAPFSCVCMYLCSSCVWQWM